MAIVSVSTLSNRSEWLQTTSAQRQEQETPKMEVMIRVGEIGANVTKVILGDELALDGADLIPIDYGGRLITPSVPVNELGKQLLRAAGEGNIEETKALLGRGALFTADWLGTSPLHLAARNNHLEICEILLNAGISRDARTKVDKTSLHMAAYEGHVHVVETLLEHGADPDCKDMLGMTPLQWAVQNGHVDVVKTLIKHFAETTSANKFDLAAVDIATQINRQDLVDIITTGTVEPRLSLASEHLTMELMSENSHGSDLISGSVSGSPIPLETILMEENNVIEPEKFQGNGMEQDLPEPVLETNSATFAESIKLLQEHGITMLPHDDDNILSTVMQTGHSVVLTDIGKEVLNSLKEEDNKIIKPKKILTVTPEEFLVMTNNCNSSKTNILKQINGRLVPKNVKRIIMKKNKILPVSTAVNTGKAKPSATDMETVMMQLVEAKKTIEEYKIKLYKKEQEAERYKQQLKLLMDNS